MRRSRAITTVSATAIMVAPFAVAGCFGDDQDTFGKTGPASRTATAPATGTAAIPPASTATAPAPAPPPATTAAPAGPPVFTPENTTIAVAPGPQFIIEMPPPEGGTEWRLFNAPDDMGGVSLKGMANADGSGKWLFDTIGAGSGILEFRQVPVGTEDSTESVTYEVKIG